jgi:hypothetical protein
VGLLDGAEYSAPDTGTAQGSVGGACGQRAAGTRSPSSAAGSSGPPPAKELARAAAAEPNLLLRPMLIAGKKVLVAFDRAEYDKLGVR